MSSRYFKLLASFLLAQIALPTQFSQAVLVRVEYFDQGFANPDTNGGPLWTGEVDTQADTLQIIRWRELPGHGSQDFLVPNNIQSIVWQALDSSGNPYDVPDNFGPIIGGTVSIGGDWGFFSSLTVQDMSWKRIIFDSGGTPVGEQSVDFAGFIPTIAGWGGYAQDFGSGFRYFTNVAPLFSADFDNDGDVDGDDLTEWQFSYSFDDDGDANFDGDTDGSDFLSWQRQLGAVDNDPLILDETTMPRLPVAPVDMNDPSTALFPSRDAIVTVVPEASAFLGCSLIAAACGSVALRRKRRRRA